MRIEQLKLQGFGIWIDSAWELQPGLNLLLLPNEAGKSTWLRGLVAMLYGGQWAGARRARKMPWWELDQPWQPRAEYGGAVVYHVRGQTYRIQRDLASGEVEVTELATGQEITQEFGRTARTVRYVLDEQLGLSPEAWTRLCCWTATANRHELSGWKQEQKWVQEGNQLLATEMNRWVGREDSKPARASLAAALRELGTITTPQKRLGQAYRAEQEAKQQLLTLQAAQRSLLKERRSLEQLGSMRAALEYQQQAAQTALRDLETERAQQEEQRDRYLQWLADKPSPFVLASMYETLQKQHRQAEQTRHQLEAVLSLFPYPRPQTGPLRPEERALCETAGQVREVQHQKQAVQERLGRRGKLFAGFLALLAGVQAFGLQWLPSDFWWKYLPLVGIGWLAYHTPLVRDFLWYHREAKRLQQQAQGTGGMQWLRRYDRAWEAYQGAQAALAASASAYGKDPAVWQRLRTASQQWEEEQPGVEPGSLEGNPLLVQMRELEASYAAQAQYGALQEAALRGTLEARLQATETLPEAYAAWEQAEKQLQALLQERAALQLALQTLEELAVQHRPDITGKLGVDAQEWFEAITAGRYGAWSIEPEQQFSLAVRLQGSQRMVPEHALSLGAQDQVGLSLRCALLQAWHAQTGVALPLCLDDALQHYDDQRLGIMLSLLATFSEKHQVLIASCHQRERQWLEEEGIAYHLVTPLASS